MLKQRYIGNNEPIVNVYNYHQDNKNRQRFKLKDIMTKKLIVSVIVFITAMTASAADPYFGVRLSMDVTVPSHSHGEYKTGSGFSVGAVYNLPVYKRLYLEPGLMFFYNTMGVEPFEIDGHLYDGSVRNLGLRLPVNIGYDINVLDNLTIGLFTGPWLNFNISSREHVLPDFEGPEPTGSADMFDRGWKRFDLQWGFGLKVCFAEHYYLGLSGGVGLTPLARYGNDNKPFKMYRNSFGLALGYNF